MKTRFIILCFLLASVNVAFSQYGNEWITYSQKYYKFKIVDEGIYRINYTDMVNSGISASTINPQNFQIFAREREQPILVVDNGTIGVFEAGDYIEFYAKGNDGWLDSLLYPSPSDITNPDYSLYNDTILYYLTWNNLTANKRIVIETDTAYNSYTNVNYGWKDSHLSFHSMYNAGERDGEGTSYPYFVDGEGWTSNNLATGGVFHYYPSSSSAWINTSSPDAFVTMKFLGTNNQSGVFPNHHTQIAYNGNTVIDTSYNAYTVINESFSIPNTSIVSGGVDITYSNVGTGTDYQAISYINLTYPHTFNLENSNLFTLRLPYNTSENKSRVFFNNLNAGTPALYVFGDTTRIIPLVNTGSGFEALIPNNVVGNDNTCFFWDATNTLSITSLTPVGTVGTFTDFTTFNLDSVYVIVANHNLLSSAQAYASYRSARYNTLVIDADELYDQFGGGIPKHALAIKRMEKYLLDNAAIAPSNLFLIGKSVREADLDNGSDIFGARHDISSYSDNLLPSFGYPSSDALFTCGLLGSGVIGPAIPTGRISALTNADVNAYLSKMMELENLQNTAAYLTIDDRDWLKQVLHLGGGAGASQQATFRNYLLSFQAIVEGIQFGGNVHGFYRGINDPTLDPTVSNQIRQQFTDGVSLVTFYGHSGGGAFDFSIDDPSLWGNSSGKYPLMIANACFSGDIHEPTQLPSYPSTSESYTMYNNGGTIGYISTIKIGYELPLYLYSTKMYQEFSNLNYNGTIGQCMQHTAASLPTTGIAYESTYYEMTLEGDPALRLQVNDKSELVIEDQSVYFEPSQITLQDLTFDVNVAITNTGMATTDTFTVELIRHFPSGGDSVYIKQVFGIYYVDTVTFTLPTSHNVATGLNTFEIRVDLGANNDVVEYEEITNNQLFKTLFITTDGIKPIYPYKYAIVPKDSVVLKASTINPLATIRTYLFEIDTTDAFNSPMLRQKSFTQTGGVVHWNLFNDGYIMQDSTVYFWRVAADSTSPVWEESSFQYIRGREGWGQSHFFQFKNDEFSSVIYNKTAREFQFGQGVTNGKEVYCDVYGNADIPDEWTFTLWGFDGIWEEYGACSAYWSAIHVAVIDELTLQSWGTYACVDNSVPCGSCVMVNPANQFGNANNNCSACRSRSSHYFIFWQNDSTQLVNLNNMLTTSIPANDYVLIYTMFYATYDTWAQWTPQLFTTMTNLGATTIGSGAAMDSVPFIFFGKVGDLTSAQEVIGTYPDEFIQLTDSVYGLNYAGSMKSEIAGPASDWQALHWQHHTVDGATTKDSLQLRMYGIDYTGTEQLLIDTAVVNNTDSIVNLSTYIDATVYPWARLEAYVEDDSLFSPTQMDRWQLVYSPLPEAALNKNKGFYLSLINDTLHEGESLDFALAIENVSDYNMDSLLVHYWVENQEHFKNYITYPRQDSLHSLEVLIDTITVPSTDYPGLNSLWIEVNPVPLTSTIGVYDQLEQYHFNNIAQIPFYATQDKINPILDVTFDGIHILDGDIVSAQPEIHIALDDENPYLLLNDISDTANFSVRLTDPQGSIIPIYFTGSGGTAIMQWIPASGPDNKSEILWNPTFTADGVYTITVKGDDKSGNASGDLAYTISFEVVLESTITEILNYPNPFSTKTQFVFTLTGTVPPSNIKIQIFTIAGRVVREIDQDELGPIHIGRNQTTFWWNGTDDFGDQLANGVYFYRVIVKNYGEDVKYNETEAVKYFHRDKKGAMFGKMYLMR